MDGFPFFIIIGLIVFYLLAVFILLFKINFPKNILDKIALRLEVDSYNITRPDFTNTNILECKKGYYDFKCVYINNTRYETYISFKITLNNKSGYGVYYNTGKLGNNNPGMDSEIYMYNSFELDNKKRFYARLSDFESRKKLKYINESGYQLEIKDKIIAIKKNLNTLISINNKEMAELENNIDHCLYISGRLIEETDDNELLYNIVRTDYDLEVVIMILIFLLKNDDREQHYDFFKEIAGDPDPLIRSFAEFGLEKNVSANLMNLIMSSAEPAIMYAVDYIYQYPGNSSDFFDLYKAALYNAEYNFKIKFYIIEMLNKINSDLSINLIFRFIDDNRKEIDNNRNFKKKLIDFFCKNKFSQSDTWLISQLNNIDEIYNIKIIEILGNLGSIKAIEYLQFYVNNVFPIPEKKAAINAINKIQKNMPADQEGSLYISDDNSTGRLSIDNDPEKGNLSPGN